MICVYKKQSMNMLFYLYFYNLYTMKEHTNAIINIYVGILLSSNIRLRCIELYRYYITSTCGLSIIFIATNGYLFGYK